MNRDERIILSFLTGKEQESVDNIKRENMTLSKQEIAILTEKALKNKQWDTFSYLENNDPCIYSVRPKHE